MPYTLAYRDRYLRVDESKITSDTSNSIAFASIPDNVSTRLVTEWTGKQFTKLLSALSTGAKLMFPDEANEIIWQLVKVVHQPIPLEPEADGCINYLPYAPFLNYEPSNPFNEPDLIPEGYINQPFHYNSDLAYPELLGYKATDVLVPIDAIPVFGDWGDLLGLHFPTIKIHVSGQGQIELDLLAVPLGGQCIIKIGSPPNILDIIDGVIETGVTIVDLNQDTIAIPPESDLVQAEEIPIDAPEGTDVYLVFVPKIDAATEFFGMGGGIRQIGLCGLETDAIMAGIEDIRFSTVDEGGSNLFLHKRVAGVWSIVDGADLYTERIELAYQSADRAENIAYALYEAADLGAGYEADGIPVAFEGSELKSYIDNADTNNQITANNAAADAAAAAAAAAAAQSTANSAVSVNNTQNTAITAIQSVNTTQNTAITDLQNRMNTAEIDIAILEADMSAAFNRLNVLDFAGAWSWEHDFTAAGIYTATTGSWSSGFGWNSVGQELVMSYPLVAPKQNQISHVCIEVVSNNMAYPILEWTWAGVGLSDDWLAIDWQGVGVINKCWMRFPNHNFIIGNMGLKVRIDTGSFTVRKMTYLGKGTNIPLA